MGRKVAVVRSLVTVYVMIPEDMDEEKFDDEMESKYEAIKAKLEEVANALPDQLVDDGAVLEGFFVDVEAK